MTLFATVKATDGAGPVGEGTVSFEILDNGTQIGTQLTAGTVGSSGMASATYVLPGGTAALGTYTIVATYNPGPDYTGSDNSLQPPPPFMVNKASTSVAPGSATAVFGSIDQNVTLTAVVTATNGVGSVNEGTVTFTVLNSMMVVIGTPVTSGTVSGGNASAVYTLLGNTVAGTYTIVATYNPKVPNPNYLTSTSSTTLTVTVNPAPTTTTTINETVYFGSLDQDVPLSAMVTATGGAGPVNQGTVTFQVFNGATQIGVSTISATVSGGNAFATYVLPANTPVGLYSIVATYNPSDNTSPATTSRIRSPSFRPPRPPRPSSRRPFMTTSTRT